MTVSRTSTGALLLILGVFLLVGCSDDTVPLNAPDGHTVVQDGVAHASGLNSPAVNCTACHGATLEGGDNGEPSCFSCHGREW